MPNRDPMDTTVEDLVVEKERRLTGRNNLVTKGESANGWTEKDLQAYIAERDSAVARVHRLGRFADTPPPFRHINAEDFNPHDW